MEVFMRNKLMRFLMWTAAAVVAAVIGYYVQEFLGRKPELVPANISARIAFASPMPYNILTGERRKDFVLHLTNNGNTVWSDLGMDVYLDCLVNAKKEDGLFPSRLMHLNSTVLCASLSPGSSEIVYLASSLSSTTRILSKISEGIGYDVDRYVSSPVVYAKEKKGSIYDYRLSHFVLHNATSTKPNLFRNVEEVERILSLYPEHRSIPTLTGEVSATMRFILVLKGKANNINFRKVIYINNGWGATARKERNTAIEDDILDYCFISGVGDLGYDLYQEDVYRDTWRPLQAKNTYGFNFVPTLEDMNKQIKDQKADFSLTVQVMRIRFNNGLETDAYTLVPVGKDTVYGMRPVPYSYSAKGLNFSFTDNIAKVAPLK
jgi:hypothetical protein